jgi:Peptidase propeptide and YPEB domain
LLADRRGKMTIAFAVSLRAELGSGGRMNWLLLSLVAGFAAQQPAAGACKEARRGLASRATVSCADARTIALRQVKARSTVKSAELEVEHGRLVYSFDLVQPGRSGVEEVQVDARTREVVSMRHETARAESKEKD